MEFGGAVKVEYWAVREGTTITVFDPDGIERFREALAQNYASTVHARPGPCGGLYGFTVEFLTSFSLQHFVNLILDGVAYDLVKSGSKALVLRPFVAAYDALKRRNADRRFRIHIEEVMFTFCDSVIVIHDLGRDTVLSNLQTIIQALAENYSHLTLRTGERPFTISIPIFEDAADDRL